MNKTHTTAPVELLRSTLQTYIPYIYRVEVDRVVDGDTIDFFFDLGFHTASLKRVRLSRINCPELHTAKGEEVKKRVEGILQNAEVWVATNKTGAYGRYIGEVFFRPIDDDGPFINLNNLMLDMKLAELYQ